jgi:hypothetical protein
LNFAAESTRRASRVDERAESGYSDVERRKKELRGGPRESDRDFE